MPITTQAFLWVHTGDHSGACGFSGIVECTAAPTVRDMPPVGPLFGRPVGVPDPAMFCRVAGFWGGAVLCELLGHVRGCAGNAGSILGNMPVNQMFAFGICPPTGTHHVSHMSQPTKILHEREFMFMTSRRFDLKSLYTGNPRQ